MRDRLIKLLQLSQSSNDFEALAAIRKANAVLRANNMDWNQYFSRALPQGQRIIITSTGPFSYGAYFTVTR